MSLQFDRLPTSVTATVRDRRRLWWCGCTSRRL